jgi:ISXO2-like transposase domain/Transposase zinc-ribbon domain
MTYTDFLRLFPDNGACMDYLRDRFYPAGSPCPKCGKGTKFHRIKGRSAYACQYCRHQVYPTAGTIFHKSTTSLQLWFWAIFLMSSTRCGISAKQLEREIGTSYKTAHRMFKQIRSLLSDDDGDPLSGEAEADESAYGGKPRASDTAAGTAYEKRSKRPTMFAMVERGGRVRARVVGGRTTGHLEEHMERHILPSSMIFTDDWSGYSAIGCKYRAHRRINHSARVYVEGTTHTQTVEGFFGLFKSGVRGVYHAISTAYLQELPR